MVGNKVPSSRLLLPAYHWVYFGNSAFTCSKITCSKIKCINECSYKVKTMNLLQFVLHVVSMGSVECKFTEKTHINLTKLYFLFDVRKLNFIEYYSTV